MSNKESGINAENYFISCLNKIGISYDYIDDWYDFKVLGQKVEVKSCMLTIYYNKNKKDFRAGRFDFTSEENKDLQIKNNIWVCFIIRYYGQFIILGFVRAKEIKNNRYISVHKVRSLEPVFFNDWIKKYNKKSID